MGCACVDTGFKQELTNDTRFGTLPQCLEHQTARKNLVVGRRRSRRSKSEGRPPHKWGRYGVERRYLQVVASETGALTARDLRAESRAE